MDRILSGGGTGSGSDGGEDGEGSESGDQQDDVTIQSSSTDEEGHPRQSSRLQSAISQLRYM